MTPPDGPPSARAAVVEAAVIRRLAPSPEFLDRVAKVRARLPELVRAAAATRGSPLVRAVVAGSAARGTFLTDRLDIDLFLLFPPDLSRERLREEGLALGRAVLTETTMRYAEHPYLRGRFEGFAVDAVPGYAVTDPSRPLSAVDRTPFHQEYLAARETPELVDQIRLAKQFLRGLGVYGSEARTEGFSGYLLELLVVRFGSFDSFLEAARSWRVPVRLQAPGTEPPRLPEDVALVLADPVDPNRNVATALSRRNLGITIVAAGAYLHRPDERWFELRPAGPLSRAEALVRTSERESHVSVLRLPRPELVDDTLIPQLRKAERAVVQELERGGFTVLGSASATGPDEVLVAVELAAALRPAVQRRDGPPAGIDRVGSFLDKWTAPDAAVLQGPYVREDGSLAVESRTPLRDAESFLREALPRLGLGRQLRRAETVRVQTLRDAEESPALAEALAGLFAKRLPFPPPATAD